VCETEMNSSRIGSDVRLFDHKYEPSSLKAWNSQVSCVTSNCPGKHTMEDLRFSVWYEFSCGLLGFCAMWSCRCIQMLYSSMLPSSLGLN
jgi:hypothetical protein